MADGKVSEVKAGNFKEFVVDEGIQVIDFWAPWCGPCKSFAPTFEKAAAANPDIQFGKVNTDEEQALAAAFNIQSIPTLMIFRDRVLLFQQPGALPPAALDDLLRQVRGLDMAQVRKEIEEKEKAAGATNRPQA